MPVLMRRRRSLNHEGAAAFLVSFPKSGRTWLRFMLCAYFNDMYGLGVELDLNSMFSIVPNAAKHPARGWAAFKASHPRRMPLIGATHGLAGDRRLHDKPIIFLVRRPKDAIASGSYGPQAHKQAPSFIDTLRLDDAKGILRYCQFMNGWARQLAETPHAVVSYESMKQDTGACLANVLRLLEVPVETAKLSAAVEAASFENMRRLNLESGLGTLVGPRRAQGKRRIQHGTVGRGAVVLGPEVVDFIDRTLDLLLTDDAKRLLEATEPQG